MIGTMKDRLYRMLKENIYYVENKTERKDRRYHIHFNYSYMLGRPNNKRALANSSTGIISS